MAKESILLSVYGKSRVLKGEWKIFGGILFCRFDNWLMSLLPFYFFIVVTYKPTCKNPKPVLWRKKQHQTTFKLQGISIFKLFTIWVIFYDWRQKFELFCYKTLNELFTWFTCGQIGKIKSLQKSFTHHSKLYFLHKQKAEYFLLPPLLWWFHRYSKWTKIRNFFRSIILKGLDPSSRVLH